MPPTTAPTDPSALQKLATLATRPGVKSTELYTAVLTMLAAIVAAKTGIPETMIYGILMVGGSYVLGRTGLKLYASKLLGAVQDPNVSAALKLAAAVSEIHEIEDPKAKAAAIAEHVSETFGVDATVPGAGK